MALTTWFSEASPTRSRSPGRTAAPRRSKSPITVMDTRVWGFLHQWTSFLPRKATAVYSPGTYAPSLDHQTSPTASKHELGCPASRFDCWCDLRMFPQKSTPRIGVHRGQVVAPSPVPTPILATRGSRDAHGHGNAGPPAPSGAAGPACGVPCTASVSRRLPPSSRCCRRAGSSWSCSRRGPSFRLWAPLRTTSPRSRPGYGSRTRSRLQS